MVVLYSKGVHGSETDGIMTQSQKCIKYDKQSFLFDEHLSKGEREFFSLASMNKECPQTILFLNQILMQC
jgi:hypothetical protein